MLWPFTTSEHPAGPSDSNFFLWRRRRHTFSGLFLKENHELSRSHSLQIDLSCQGLHSSVLLPCRLRSKVAGVAYQCTYMHKLLLLKLVKVTSGRIFVKEFCYTSGSHGSSWANFCSPSKTKNLVQILTGMPERASKNVATERNSFLHEHELIFNFSRRTVCPRWAEVTWAGSELCIFRPWFHLFYYDIEIYQ